MELRQLTYFLQVCQDGSLLRASEHVFITQQALSKSISSLEQELGEALFERTPRGLVLTEAGQVMQSLAQTVINDLDTLTNTMREFHSVNSNRITFGISSGLQHFISMNELYQFANTIPGLSLHVEEVQTDICIDMIRKGKLTAAMTNGTLDVPELVNMNLLNRNRIAIVNKHSPLARREQISIRDLKGESLALNINNHCYSRFCALCEKENIQPQVFRIGDTSTMFELCNDQGYLGISVDYLLQRSWPGWKHIVAIPMDPDEFTYPVNLVISRSRYHYKVVKQFIRYIRDTVQANNTPGPALPFDFAVGG